MCKHKIVTETLETLNQFSTCHVIYINMQPLILTHQMEINTVFVAIAAPHNDSEVASFLNIMRFFVFKIRPDRETSDRDVAPMAKRMAQFISSVSKENRVIRGRAF